MGWRWRAFSGMTWSRHSRRRVPITRSAMAFARGSHRGEPRVDTEAVGPGWEVAAVDAVTVTDEVVRGQTPVHLVQPVARCAVRRRGCRPSQPDDGPITPPHSCGGAGSGRLRGRSGAVLSPAPE